MLYVVLNDYFMKRISLISTMMLVGRLAYADISGTVFEDLPVNGQSVNTYGVKDSNELGVGGVTVTAYPGGISTTTAADGTYMLPINSGALRLEFTWDSKPWYKSSPDGNAQNSSVKFVTAPATNVNFGLFIPNDYRVWWYPLAH